MLGNASRNLHEIVIRMTSGDALVPAPCRACAGIKPIGLECVASFAGARDALRTTFARRRRDVHHAAKFAVPLADAYQLIVFHVTFLRLVGTARDGAPWSGW